jgi:hypothetical protein
MFRRNNIPVRAALLALAPALLSAQPPAAGLRNSFQVRLPAGSPVSVVSADWGQSSAAARGGAMQVELHSTLVLKNSSPRRIRAVSLLVLAQEVTPGGRGSVTVPSLDIAPGESFPVRIDLRLMRPLAPAAGALVEVGLDGVLFEDLTFFGPNRLNTRRAMLAWEMEARRDRKALLAALESGGEGGLRNALLAAVARAGAQSRIPVQVARALPATNVEDERSVQFAFLQVPDSPVELLSGEARMAQMEVRAPRIELRNGSRRSIKFVELGWLARDGQGLDYAAGTLPAEIALAPGQRSTIRQDGALRFSRPVSALTAYPAVVEFADGGMWVPPSAAWQDARLAQSLPVSGELARLAGLYRLKGLQAVVQQLRSMR